jgi:hypothetical protein
MIADFNLIFQIYKNFSKKKARLNFMTLPRFKIKPEKI